MLSKQDAQKLADKVMSFAKLPECRVSVTASENVFIRFANNGITTSGYQVGHTVSITCTTEDKRSGNASVTELTDDALRRGVYQAELLARISKPNPEDMPALGPQKYPEIPNFDSGTADARGENMIVHVKAIIDEARSRKLTAAGLQPITVPVTDPANQTLKLIDREQKPRVLTLGFDGIVCGAFGGAQNSANPLKQMKHGDRLGEPCTGAKLPRLRDEL